MANAVYPNGITAAITGLVDLDTGVLKAAFVRGYAYNAAHTFVSDVTGAGGTLNGSAALTSVTVSVGVLDAADLTITTTASAADHSLIIYQASAPTGGADVAASAQRLLYFYDTATGTPGLPIKPGSGDVSIAWDNGSSKIVKYG